MKRIILLIACLDLLCSAGIACAEQLNDWEKGIFQDIAEDWHEMRYSHGGNYMPNTDDIAQIEQKAAAKYNISLEDVQMIDVRGIFAEEPSEQYYKIYNDLIARLSKLTTDYTKNDSDRIHIDVANKYGISVYKLHEIEYIMEEGCWDIR